MKKKIYSILSACVLVIAIAALAPMTAFAVHTPGEWKSNSTGWWYGIDDGYSYIYDDLAAINGYLYSFDYYGYMQTG